MNTRIITTLTVTVALLVFLIGAGSFVLSYDALYATGLQYGSFVTGKVWIFPLLIDAPLVVFTLALLIFQIMRQSAKLWISLVILYTLGTIGFNLSHAQQSLLGWLVAIVAPIGLLLTTEALRHLAKVIIERQNIVSSLAQLVAQYNEVQAQHNILSNKTAELKTQLAQLKAEKKAQQYQGISGETKQRAIEILAQRSDISGAELGRQLGRSDTLGRRLKKELLPTVNSQQNGKGQNETL